MPRYCFAFGYLLRPWALPLAGLALALRDRSDGRTLPVHGCRQLAVDRGMGIVARVVLTPARLRRRLLRTVGERLRHAVRSSDPVGR